MHAPYKSLSHVYFLVNVKCTRTNHYSSLLTICIWKEATMSANDSKKDDARGQTYETETG